MASLVTSLFSWGYNHHQSAKTRDDSSFEAPHVVESIWQVAVKCTTSLENVTEEAWSLVSPK